MVSASPLTPSSHHAGEDFAKLQEGERCDIPLRLTLSIPNSTARRRGANPQSAHRIFTW